METTNEHFDKYEALCKEKDVDFIKSAILGSISKEEIVNALQNGEGHLNEIKLKRWDGLAHYAGWTAKRDGKIFKSLAEQVCLLKHIAKYHIAKPNWSEVETSTPQ